MNMTSTSTFDACFTHQFKLNFLETEKVAIGHSVSSEVISAGGHLWRMICYPRGERKDNYEYLSIFQDANGAGLPASPFSPPRKIGPLDNRELLAFLLRAGAVEPASACGQLAEPKKSC
jgi:hypothetical protein